MPKTEKKRGRGRPKMSEAEKKAAAEVRAKKKAKEERKAKKEAKKSGKDTKEKAPKKKAGRPKKEDKPEKKKRGRPKKTEAAPKKTAKKKAGSPKKSTTKKPAKSKKATGKPMSKSEIAAFMAESQEMTKADAKNFIEAFVELTVSETKKNGSFSITGLGKFVKSRRKSRWARNPATGEKIKTKAKTVVKARLSKAFKDAVL